MERELIKRKSLIIKKLLIIITIACSIFPYPPLFAQGDIEQVLVGGFNSGCLNIFSYLTGEQQAAVQIGTSIIDFSPILTSAMNAPSVHGSRSYSGTSCIFFPPGTYAFNSTINIKHAVDIRGSGGGGGLATGAAATKLVFAANIPGFIINRYNTLGNATISPATTAGDGTVIEDLAITDASSSWSTDPLANSAVWLRARAALKNININWSAGTGIKIVASQGGGGSAEGVRRQHLWPRFEVVI